jgi:hypothetical protein
MRSVDLHLEAFAFLLVRCGVNPTKPLAYLRKRLPVAVQTGRTQGDVLEPVVALREAGLLGFSKFVLQRISHPVFPQPPLSH